MINSVSGNTEVKEYEDGVVIGDLGEGCLDTIHRVEPSDCRWSREELVEMKSRQAE